MRTVHVFSVHLLVLKILMRTTNSGLVCVDVNQSGVTPPVLCTLWHRGKDQHPAHISTFVSIVKVNWTQQVY